MVHNFISNIRYRKVFSSNSFTYIYLLPSPSLYPCVRTSGSHTSRKVLKNMKYIVRPLPNNLNF